MVYKIEDALQNKDMEMAVEKNRLKSFRKGWPFADGACTKENLAKAGFYFCSPYPKSDCVRCFCCFKELEGWEQADDPWVEHLSHNSTCLFAQTRKEERELTVVEMLRILDDRTANRQKKQKAVNLIADTRLHGTSASS